MGTKAANRVRERPCPPADVLAALAEVVATGIASGMIDRAIPVRGGCIDAARPGEAARIAVHLATSPAACEWAAVREPLAGLLRQAVRLAAAAPSLAGHQPAPAGTHHRPPARERPQACSIPRRHRSGPRFGAPGPGTRWATTRPRPRPASWARSCAMTETGTPATLLGKMRDRGGGWQVLVRWFDSSTYHHDWLIWQPFQFRDPPGPLILQQ